MCPDSRRVLRAPHRDDLQHGLQLAEVFRITGLEREIGSQGRCRDQPVECAPTMVLGPDATTSASTRPQALATASIHRQRIERGLSPLQTVLTAGALGFIFRRVGSGCQLGQGARRDR